MTELVTDGQTDNQELETPDNMDDKEPSAAEQPKFVTRKEKRKALKKEKRKHIRKELAEKARVEEEARLNDPEEQRKIQLDEEREKERLERERKEFEGRERIFLEELQRKKKEEEEQERKNAVDRESNLKQDGAEEGSNEDDEWEYVEEGPPEIIWQGNEIIVKKNKVRVKKKAFNQDKDKEDPNRPTSNPLPPQSEAYAAYKNAPMTSAELLDTVAQQVPNFGTEQDKAHCPFHIKTGACRFGLRCNRVHYYPDKSNTLLIKNMYNGPGLAWEQDEGLEHTDEEVERSYEDFYEDVHTEFLKFGEIINFKVCRNGSFHLRGNVYVHYKSLDSAVMAYNSVHGRYFAGKQVKCEFVSVTKWKVAICGEYMKSRLKTCSRGSACNFLHCFSNPGGDYEWADCDKPPPRYWMKKMTALFGYSEESWHDTSPKTQQHSSRIFTSDRDSYHNKRHLSMETNQHNGSSSRSHHEKNHLRKSRHHERQEADKYEKETEYKNNQSRRRSKSRDLFGRNRTPAPYGSSDDEDLYSEKRYVYTKRRSRHRKDISESSNDDEESNDVKHESSERRKEDKTRSSRHHQRSRRHNREESEKFAKRHNRKPARDRSKSRDNVHFSEKNEMMDRWGPESSPVEDEDCINVGVKKDYEISDDGKMEEMISCSGGVEEESSGVGKNSERKSRRNRDRDDRMREKRKRI